MCVYIYRMLQNIKCSILGTNTPFVLTTAYHESTIPVVCVWRNRCLGLHFGRPPKYKKFPTNCSTFCFKNRRAVRAGSRSRTELSKPRY